MIATGLNIHAYKGADVDIEIFVKDENGDPYELTGLNYLRIYTRFEKTSFLDIPLTWSTNKYTGSLTNSQTAALSAIEYYLEWLTISGTDYNFPIKGNLYVSDVFKTHEETATNILTVNSVTTTIEIQNTVNAPIDSALSATSIFPVQNKVVDLELKTKKNFSGFENRTDSVITAADSGGWKVTIAPVTTSFNVWAGKVKRTFTTAQIISVPTDLTLYYIYVDEDGLFTAATSFDFSTDNAPAAVFYRDGTAYALTDERHSYARNRIQHSLDHNTIGARYKSGLTGAFLDATFSIAQGVIYDEDIRFDTGAAKTTTTHWHRAATLDRMRLVRSNTTIYPIVSTNLAYDLAGILTAMDANRYGVYWVYASNDPEEPIYTVVSQAQYNNLTLARNAAAPTIYLSTAEWKLLYRVIYRNTAPITYIEAADFRTVQTGTPITATTQDHSALINRDALNSHPATAITVDEAPVANYDNVALNDTGQVIVNKLLGVQDYATTKLNYSGGDLYVTAAVNAANFTTAALATNRIYLYPFIPSQSFNCTTIYIDITAGIALSSTRVGLYGDLNGLPNDLLYQSADMDSGAAGTPFVSPDINLYKHKVYWIAVQSSSTPTLRHIPTGSLLPIGVGVGASAFQIQGFRTDVAYASGLPATITGAIAVVSQMPVVKFNINTIL